MHCGLLSGSHIGGQGARRRGARRPRLGGTPAEPVAASPSPLHARVGQPQLGCQMPRSQTRPCHQAHSARRETQAGTHRRTCYTGFLTRGSLRRLGCCPTIRSGACGRASSRLVSIDPSLSPACSDLGTKDSRQHVAYRPHPKWVVRGCVDRDPSPAGNAFWPTVPQPKGVLDVTAWDPPNLPPELQRDAEDLPERAAGGRGLDVLERLD